MDAGSDLVEQQGIAYAKTVAEAMNLKLDMDNPADREKLRRAVLELVAGRKMPTAKSSLTISAQPVGIGAASQRSIPTGEQCGLKTQLA